MAKTGKFLHNPRTEVVVAGIGTTYNAAKYHTLDLASIRPSGNKNTTFKGFIEGLIFGVENIAGGATKVTLRICADARGDISMIGDVEVALDLGITDPTLATGQIYYDSFPFEQPFDDNAYIFYKCDAGSLDVNYVQVSWSE